MAAVKAPVAKAWRRKWPSARREKRLKTQKAKTASQAAAARNAWHNVSHKNEENAYQ